VGDCQRNHTQGLSIEVISSQTVVDLVLWQRHSFCVENWGINCLPQITTNRLKVITNFDDTCTLFSPPKLPTSPFTWKTHTSN